MNTATDIDVTPIAAPAPFNAVTGALGVKRGPVGKFIDHALKYFGTPAEKRLATMRISARKRAGAPIA